MRFFSGALLPSPVFLHRLRRTSWKRKHVVVANVEQALIITSAAEPRMKPNLIDRILVTCERSGIKPIICINKIDLVDPASLQPFVGVYARMGYRTVLFSAKTGFNLDRLRRILVGRESVVVGQSGVGKSSALNAIDFIDVACCFYDHDRHKIVCVYQAGEDRRRQIATALVERLPKYMRPNKYIRMEQMPLNAHVKIDRRLLRTMYEEGKLK